MSKREYCAITGIKLTEEDSERHYVVDYVLYFGFVQLILTTSKIIDDGE